MTTLQASELIINADGSVYHLGIKPEELADWIITVGDPDRVEEVSKYFDSVEIIKNKREFVIHTGTLEGKPITVLSTGMGTDNIDIVMNELDALVNIDFEKRTIKNKHTSLKIIRLGTSGAIQSFLPLNTLLVSEMAIGYDGLLGFYHIPPYREDIKAMLPHFGHLQPGVYPASEALMEKLAKDIYKGVTYTAAGFYAPQGRQLRVQAVHQNLTGELSDLVLPDGKKVTNMEMETSGLYGLGAALGHEVISFSTLLANRINGTFSNDPAAAVDFLIQTIIQRIREHINH